ncbi:S8 family peptidase [Paenibacillus sp. KN14-4R]|uniref:S8 family peptidase n=1 Tax=Paenibacillus sp. KN14-4R TaxID=3445773 RepID=UPI003FA0D5E1
MDPEPFIETLHDEIHLSSKAKKRQIIRFENTEDYDACIDFIKTWQAPPEEKQSIQELKIIQAISCPIHSLQSLMKFTHAVSIEEDSTLSIHYQADNYHSFTNQSSIRSHFYPVGNQLIPWGVKQVKAPLTWTKTRGSEVRIGVIDTGVDPTHPDLKPSIYRGVNLLFPGMLPNDDNGHGTHIAGIIAGASTRKGILGVAPQASIHAVKAFDRLGSAYVSDIIAGINWCVENNMDIINMSFGMSSYSKALENAVQHAYKAGKIIIASCGNEGKKASVDYPARFPQVVSVGAITQLNRIAPFSNKGKRIDIYAPGEKIYSCWLNGNYNELSGTSMATAHVSGVVALMLSTKPNLKPLQIKKTLKQYAVTLTKEVKASAGQINARRVINAITKTRSLQKKKIARRSIDGHSL